MQSPRSDFFLVVPPGLEFLARQELQEKGPQLGPFLETASWQSFTVTVVTGGLEIAQLPWHAGFALNHLLKIPTRILLRLSRFKCRDFPKLFNKVRKLPWASFLCGPNVKVHVAAHQSRLMHHGRIGETVSSGLTHFFRAFPPKKALLAEQALRPAVGIYVRFQDDECQISIDTSGSPLYKRWPGKKVGRAPMRENLAAAMFLRLRQEFPPAWQEIALVDPFCGSGTLLGEALSFAQGHGGQDYGFLQFPCFYAQQATPALLDQTQQLSQRNLVHLHCYGFDRNPQWVTYAQENFSHLGARFAQDDLFTPAQAVAQELHERYDGVCIFTNPPYGQRLGLATTPHRFYEQILAQIVAKWKPALMGFVAPLENPAKTFAVPAPYRSELVCRFQNGGIPVGFFIAKA